MTAAQRARHDPERPARLTIKRELMSLRREWFALSLPLAVLLSGCGGGDGGATGTGGTTSTGSTTSTDSTASTSSTSTTSTQGTGGGASCTAAREQAVGSVDSVATGDVTVLSTSGTTQTLYVDGSAGGISAAPQNPWIFLSLKTGTKVAVSDPASLASMDWDLAVKRPLLYTNSGDGGPGKGGAAFLDGKAFDAVTSADAASAAIAPEAWFDASCEPKTDETGSVATTFTGWYDYDLSTNVLTPHPGTFIVRGGDGSLYKVGILDYYADPDGTTGTAGGRYKLEVAPLP